MLDFQFKNVVRAEESGGKFVAEAVIAIESQCTKCRHWARGTLTCTAYPAGIPQGFLTGEFDHTLPYPGDNGLRFEPV